MSFESNPVVSKTSRAALSMLDGSSWSKNGVAAAITQSQMGRSEVRL
jgi:hypothetical protein